MRNTIKTAVALTIAGASAAVCAQQPATSDGPLETILIIGQRSDRISKGATGLDLDIKDTPQSISVVSSEQMEAFGANDINAALSLATGINVERWETNRTNYMARGFEIKNTQIDGVGLPNDWGIVTGAMDAFGYEKIEVIRGANGLLTGVGNASGTINYVRKRPTNTTQGVLNVTAGSWDHRRMEADYSTPFTSDGAWAGRIVAAIEDEDSWLRGLSNDRTYVYGVIDGQIGDRATLALGYSHQEANSDGNMWGALVLAYTDGTQAEFPRSASTSQDWTFWDTRDQTAFVEYTYALPKDWRLKLTYNYRAHEEDSKLFFASTTVGIDRDTGLGLSGWPGAWPGEDESHLFDVNVDGEFEWLGRSHPIIVGFNHSFGERTQLMRPVAEDDAAFGLLPPFPYAGDVMPEPAWGAPVLDSRIDQELTRFYGAARLALTEKLASIVGFNFAEYHREGEQSGSPFDQTEREWSPYAALTYAVLERLQLYASYSDIYQPQDYYDIDHRYLDPSKGVNYEVGVKAEWLDRRLLTTLAWFTAEQQGLGTFAGMTDEGRYYYEGVDVESKGYELEITGRLNDFVDVVLGFTSLQLEGAAGEDVYQWVPRRTLNFTVMARVPALPALSLGMNGKWQSDISKVDEYTGATIRQDSYALVNAFARWDVTSSLSLRVNVDNIADEKFISSLYQIGYYGPPRNYSASVSYRF